MTITVKQITGYLFGEKRNGDEVVETKTFTSQVDFNSFMQTLEQFDAQDEIVSVHFDCK